MTAAQPPGDWPLLEAAAGEDLAPALLFLHIPKAAGTALVHVLDPLYPPAERLHLYDPRDDAVHPDDFPSLPVEYRNQLRFVAGHFLYGIHEWLPRRCSYITIIREPVDRIRSLYDHFRTYPEPGEGDWHNWITREGADLGRFVTEQRTRQSDNYMVRLLSGQDPPFGECTTAMLESAMLHLATFRVVMFQDDLEPGVARLSELLGARLPTLSRLNANLSPTDHIPARTSDMIRERNRFDVELYRYAREEFQTVVRHG